MFQTVKSIIKAVVVVAGIIVLAPVILARIALEKIRNSDEEEKE